MCTRGHVISKSEWIGVPALRRAHLLPPSRAPSLLVGWLAADCIRQQICIFNLGSSRMGGRADGRRNRSLAPQEAMRACEQHGRATYLLRAEQWAEGRNMVAQGRSNIFENANAIGFSGRLGGQMEEA